MLYTTLPYGPGEAFAPQPPVGKGLLGWLVGKPDVTLTPQLAPERIIERLGPGGIMPGITQPLEPVYKTLPFGEPVPLIERLGPGGIMPGITQPLEPVPMGLIEPVPISPQTDLAAAPKVGEWLKENRLLVIVGIVALVLLFFFLKKGRR